MLQRLEAHEPAGNGWVMALVLARHEDGRSGLMLTASYDHTVRVWVRTADDIVSGTGQTLRGGAAGGEAAVGGTGGGFSVGGCGSGGGGTGAGTGTGTGGSGSCSGGGGGYALERTLRGHTDGVLGIELSRARRHAFTGSNDRSVRVWDLRTGACLSVLNAHESYVSALGWHLASGCLATGAEDGVVNLWDVSALEDCRLDESPAVTLVSALCVQHSEVLCLASSADGTALFCGLDDGSFAVLAGTMTSTKPSA